MNVLIAILNVFLACLAFQIGKQNANHKVLDYLDNKCGNKNLPILYSITDLKMEGNVLVSNSSITVRREVSTRLKLAIKLQRCKNKENLDTCEHFYNYNENDYCRMIASRITPLGLVFSTYKPDYRCPLKKGVYRAVNSSFDVRAFVLFPMDTWYWKMDLRVRDKDTDALVYCIIAHAYVSK